MNIVPGLMITFFLLPTFLCSQTDNIITDIGEVEQSKSAVYQGYTFDLFPNGSAKSIMTPTAWGSNSTFIFGSVGGTFPQPYSKRPDLAGGGGFGTGNCFKSVSLVGILNVNDVSRFNNFSASFLASRYLGKGSSISAGALHLFANPDKSDAGSSYYLVFSHAVQSLPSKTNQASRLSYSIGLGTGRFLNKSDMDKVTGKGSLGTAIFSNFSYEIFKGFNVNAEWTGLNLGFGTSWRPTYKFPALAIGFTDVTGFSGDRIRFVCGLGHAFVFNKKSR